MSNEFMTLGELANVIMQERRDNGVDIGGFALSYVDVGGPQNGPMAGGHLGPNARLPLNKGRRLPRPVDVLNPGYSQDAIIT